MDFAEVEALIRAKTGVELKMRCESDDTVRFQPRNMGLWKNRVKVRVTIDRDYDVPGRVKLKVSAGIFSPLVLPQIRKMTDLAPSGSVAMNEDGDFIVLLEKIPQLAPVLSMCDITDIRFNSYMPSVIVDATFAGQAGVTEADFPPPPVEDYSFNSNVSLKEQEQGRIIGDIARSIFESDRIKEEVHALKERASDYLDEHKEDLHEAVMSYLSKKLDGFGKPEKQAESPDGKSGQE